MRGDFGALGRMIVRRFLSKEIGRLSRTGQPTQHTPPERDKAARAASRRARQMTRMARRMGRF